jgi:hypothetical protein
LALVAFAFVGALSPRAAATRYELSPTPVAQQKLRAMQLRGELGPRVTKEQIESDARVIPNLLYWTGDFPEAALPGFLARMDLVQPAVVDGLTVPNLAMGPDGRAACDSSRSSARWYRDPDGNPSIEYNSLLYHRGGGALDAQLTLDLHDYIRALGIDDERYQCSTLLWLLTKKKDLARAGIGELGFRVLRDQWALDLCPPPNRPFISAIRGAVQLVRLVFDDGSNDGSCERPLNEPEPHERALSGRPGQTKALREKAANATGTAPGKRAKLAGGGSVGIGGGGDERGIAWKMQLIDEALGEMFRRGSRPGQQELDELRSTLEVDVEVRRPTR